MRTQYVHSIVVISTRYSTVVISTRYSIVVISTRYSIVGIFDAYSIVVDIPKIIISLYRYEAPNYYKIGI